MKCMSCEDGHESYNPAFIDWCCSDCVNEYIESTVIHILERVRMAADWEKTAAIQKESLGETIGWLTNARNSKLLRDVMVGLAHTSPAEVKAWMEDEIKPVETYPYEVRRSKDGKIDEIVAQRANIHIEHLGKQDWWFGINFPGRKEQLTGGVGPGGTFINDAPRPEDEDKE